jgi:hypothetical protein
VRRLHNDIKPELLTGTHLLLHALPTLSQPA